jgi:shikimate dehydrogenase
MKINAKTKICMVIGDPVEHSLSPQMHNTGYEALHIDNQYVYVACHVDVNQIENFIKGIRAMRILGVSCTLPHKLAVMPYLDEIDDVAKKIGAVNTIVNKNGKLLGSNTDWIGILEPLNTVTNLTDKKVALLGAGGAARSAAYAVTNQQAKLMIFNRTKDKAEKLAEEFKGDTYALDDYERIKSADIIINTTSVGLHPHEDATPLPKEYIANRHIVFDAVYGAKDTRLIQDAKEQGAITLTGKDMLLYGGAAQFKLFTGHDAPKDAMRKALI